MAITPTKEMQLAEAQVQHVQALVKVELSKAKFWDSLSSFINMASVEIIRFSVNKKAT